MDRELLIEIGCEEIPASWLPGLTRQLVEHLDARLKELRLTTGAPSETYSTPRRLTASVTKLAERQTDFEELVTGPPVSAAFKPDGEPTPAAAGTDSPPLARSGFSGGLVASPPHARVSAPSIARTICALESTLGTDASRRPGRRRG